MEITAIDAIYVAATVFRTLDSPNLLVMVRAGKRCFGNQFLTVLIGIPDFACHAPFRCFVTSIPQDIGTARARVKPINFQTETLPKFPVRRLSASVTPDDMTAWMR
jgi:hypothetical protein